MNNILFITAFKDIGRNNWFTHKRTNEDYEFIKINSQTSAIIKK
jgi:hypothetical protein